MNNHYEKIPALIGIDWGSSHVRAYLISSKGDMLAKQSHNLGILALGTQSFLSAYNHILGSWRTEYPELPVLFSGMIGSRQGWVETPYSHCPVDVSTIAKKSLAVPEIANAFIIGGVMWQANDTSLIEVMRGEETQIFGAMTPSLITEGIICLPGTHSKWVYVFDQKIQQFTTYMSGELFHLLSTNSSLSRMIDPLSPHYPAIFAEGVTLGASPTCAFSALLFQVRTRVLAGELPSNEAQSFLSGIIIGYEVRQAMQKIHHHMPLYIIAEPELTSLYSQAIMNMGHSVTILNGEEVTVKGLLAIAKIRGLLT